MNQSAVPLAGERGELLSVSIVADPKDLEDLLDRLAQSQYPIDPQIYHGDSTVVEFPAYATWLDEIRGLIRNDETVTVHQCMTCATGGG
jgi:hypothetical protein